MLGPISAAHFLSDQLVGGLFIRHAQQRFGEAHERQALRVGETEFLKKALHHALAALQRTRLGDEPAGLGGDAGASSGGSAMSAATAASSSRYLRASSSSQASEGGIIVTGADCMAARCASGGN